MGNTRLTKLRVKEISGVDDPANELPGWLVVKSREMQHDLNGFEKAIGDLFEGLDSPEAELYFQDAPASVLKARDELLTHLGQDVEEIPESSGGVFDIEKAGAYDDPDNETHPDSATSAAQIPDQHEVPGNSGSEEPGEGQDVAPDLNPGNTNSLDKYGREIDPKTGEVLGDDKPAEEPSTEADEPEPAPEPEPEPEPEETPEPEASEKDEPEAEEPAEEPTDEKPKERSRKKAAEGDADEDGVEKSEDIAKSIAGVLEEQLSPLREAILGLAERTEGLEKHAAGRQQIDIDPDVPNSVGETGLTKAVRTALKEGRVELR